MLQKYIASNRPVVIRAAAAYIESEAGQWLSDLRAGCVAALPLLQQRSQLRAGARI